MNRQEILAAMCPKIEPVLVPVPLADDAIPPYVRSLRASEMIEIRKHGGDDQEQGVQLLVRALCDKDGNRLLLDEDAEAIRHTPPGLLNALLKAAMRVNLLSPDAYEEAKKKSPTTLAESSTGSPSSPGGTN